MDNNILPGMLSRPDSFADHHRRIDPIRTPPDISGPKGQAWQYNMGLLQSMHWVTAWLVEAPYAHPKWHSYLVGLTHLRPGGGLKPAVIYRPGATHEFTVMALNPDVPRQACLDAAVFKVMVPLNFAAQRCHPNDAEAAEEVEGIVREICEGTLNPDTDFASHWADLFGGHMVRGHKDNTGAATPETSEKETD